jgi:hypothetical protein
VRSVVRTLIAGLLVLGPAIAVFGVAPRAGAAAHELTISIDAMSPEYARPGSTITVSGTLTNHTGSALAGILVQLESSPAAFGSRSGMTSYASGGGGFIPVAVGTPDAVTGTLRSGGTARWTASFTAANAGFSQFGVYPVEATAQAADGALLAKDRTFLPYWPGSGSAKPLNIAWIWPLVDVPRQGACRQSLTDGSLATSLGTVGRLGTLLSTGLRWSRQAHLTWMVDPALLSDADVMTQHYKVGVDAGCTGTPRLPPSSAASGWLSQLRQGTADQPMFLTPYADADAAALTHAGLDSDLRTAYTLGESVAGKILSRPFGAMQTQVGDRQNPPPGTAAVAWPAGGTADASVLTSLASTGGISTTVLNSDEMPAVASPFTPDNAVTSVTTGIGTTMHVLLADSELTSLLGTAPANSSRGTQFATEQEFLAQTAMIVAELPYSERSLVVAPPRRWDPSAAEANALLAAANSAPWLRKVALSGLASSTADLAARQSLPGSKVSSGELSRDYLSQVRSVGTNMALYQQLLYRPSQNMMRSLHAAVAVTESSAWRGDGRKDGALALGRLSAYLTANERKVQIITGKKVLLAGTSGYTPVSVQNGLPVSVQVKVVASAPKTSGITVGDYQKVLTVTAGKTGTVRLPVRSSAIGTTTMQLQLVTKDGSPLAWTSESLSVQVTRYGRALLVFIAAALGVLVLASMARWIRRWLSDSGAHTRSGGTG